MYIGDLFIIRFRPKGRVEILHMSKLLQRFRWGL